jgi:2-polyprenyl-3-methyl-5-hydroxy-6-metoxy-1,4-benzoquinol methylase
MTSGSKGWLLGEKSVPNSRDFSARIAWSDHKIRFAVSHCRGKDVLDIGCVQHNPENYKNKYWLHKALKQVASTLDGMDLYEDGVNYLRTLGYNIALGDAQNFDGGKTYDVIVAGDLIEHLDNPGDFLDCCNAHLRDGGKLLLSTPNPWYWRFCVKAAFFGGRVNPNPEHTIWLCPTVLGHLLSRHGLRIESWHYGSRYWRDRIMPLPRGVKHAGIHLVVKRAA